MTMPAPTSLSAPAAPPAQDYLPTRAASPDTPEEAARAFEKVLVRRFVQTMTKDMLDSPLSGERGPGWMNSQRDQQRDMLTDVLTDHLVDANTLGISDLLLEDWGLTSDRGAAGPPPGATLDRPPHIAAQIGERES